MNIDKINFEDVYEKTCEEFNAFCAKRDILHEMILEFYTKKDFYSETVKYLEQKSESLMDRCDTLYVILQYLRNLKYGRAFNVGPKVN
jgi:hypothetical protein